MDFQFVLSYPWWFLVLCPLAGALGAALLYLNNRKTDFSVRQTRLLALFRFLTLSLLCFLLLSPLLRMRITQSREPIILLFHDNSQSLVLGTDSLYMNDQYPEALAQLTREIEKDFRLHNYTFGERVVPADTLSYTDRITDISEVFTTLESTYSNRNLGAVIIAGDGIYNRGHNPRFLSPPGFTPIYTLALGDTIPRRDVIINRLNHNRITYLNSLFPLEIVVEARQAAGLSSRLRVVHEGNTLWEQRISFTSDRFFITLPVQLEATEVGIKRYSVIIDAVPDEVSLANNRQDFYIEVIDRRQKILILAHAPHPDVGALKQALDDNENFEVEVNLLRDFNAPLQDYDLIIWHQLPSETQPSSPLMARAAQLQMPQVFVLGAQSNLNAFNRLQTGVQISRRSGGLNDARAEINPDFALFQKGEDIGRLLPLLPPLSTHFATYTLSPSAQVFAWQRIGNVTTTFPLILFTETGERKTAIITGEGIWRWRLGNFAREGNHRVFNDMVSRMIQFLSVVEDKSFFRVYTRNFIFENEAVRLDAELYNRSYEPVNEPEVNLTITNSEGVDFSYVFARTGNSYTLNAGVFPPGEYRYFASTDFSGENFTARGVFTISPLNIEGVNTVADHNLLFQMAENTGGKMFYPNQLDELVQALRNRTDIKPVMYSQYEYEDLVNMRWIFFLLLLLLSVEWFIRKYSGSY